MISKSEKETIELRCDNCILFGVLDVERKVIEFKCRSKRCGSGPGIIVIHRFDLTNGKLLKTYVFKDPIRKG